MNKEELKNFVENNRENFAIQLKRLHRELFDEVSGLFTFPTFTEKLFIYLNGGHCIGKCKICKNKTQFDGYWKGYRDFCSCKCRSKEKSNNANEFRNCVICGTEFRIYKKREKTTCSPECLLVLNSSNSVNEKRISSLKNTMLEKYGVDHPSKLPTFKQQLKETKLKMYGDENFVNVDKCKKTKLELYGDAHYVNSQKIKQTCMKKYGVPNVLYLPKHKSNGKRISKFQKKIFVEVKQKHQDALLEEYLPDVQKSVDIYIPSQKKIIECFGDYWHCNPIIYKPDYYNNLTHRTAEQTWKEDEERVKLLENSGYKVEIVWENSKKF